jgi:hypothetical protein
LTEQRVATKFTVLDWIGIVYILVQAVGLLYLPAAAASFGAYTEDMGGTLPTITVLILSPWFTYSLLPITLLIFSLQWYKDIKHSLKLRRIAIASSFAFQQLAYGVFLLGMYAQYYKLFSPVGG